MNTITVPPGFSVPVSLALLNQYEQPGTFTPPVVWGIDPQYGEFLPHPSDPGDTRLRIFRATNDQSKLGAIVDCSATVETENGPLVLHGQVSLNFPNAPVTHGVLTVGAGFPNA